MLPWVELHSYLCARFRALEKRQTRTWLTTRCMRCQTHMSWRTRSTPWRLSFRAPLDGVHPGPASEPQVEVERRRQALQGHLVRHSLALRQIAVQGHHCRACLEVAFLAHQAPAGMPHPETAVVHQVHEDLGHHCPWSQQRTGQCHSLSEGSLHRSCQALSRVHQVVSQQVVHPLDLQGDSRRWHLPEAFLWCHRHHHLRQERTIKPLCEGLG